MLGVYTDPKTNRAHTKETHNRVSKPGINEPLMKWFVSFSEGVYSAETSDVTLSDKSPGKLLDLIKDYNTDNPNQLLLKDIKLVKEFGKIFDTPYLVGRDEKYGVFIVTIYNR